MTDGATEAAARQRAFADVAEALRWPPDSDKFRLLAAILLAMSAVYGAAYFAASLSRGWPAGFGDSFALWSWGRFLAGHPAAAIYDPATLRAAQLALGMDPGASYPFVYPPPYLAVLWLLGRLSGPAACAAVIAVSLPLYLWATFGRGWRLGAALAVLAAPTTATMVVSGQGGFLTAALLAGGLRLAATNQIAAGVLLGLATYKPQLGLLVPVGLVAASLWRTAAAAVATVLLLVVATSLVFGAEIWPAWLAALPGFSRQFAAESGAILHLMPTVFAALLQLGIAPPLAQAVQWATTAALAAGVWLLYRRSGGGRLAAAALLVAAPLATPYAFVFDLPIVTTAIVWLVAECRRRGDVFGTEEVLVMVMAMLGPVTLAAGVSRIPLAALSLLLLFALILRRARRDFAVGR